MAANTARRASVLITYNHIDATQDIAPRITEFVYRDVASGESDSLSIAAENRDGSWFNTWFPVLGDRIEASIGTQNWSDTDSDSVFRCGSFAVDSVSFSGGPRSVSLEALSLPTDNNFKSRERTETYEGATLREIGQIIADRAGVQLAFDCADFTVAKIEQNQQADSAFYAALLKRYGRALKIYSNKLVVFSEADYEARAAKWVMTEQDFAPDWQWETNLQGTYAGCVYEYSNSDQDLTYRVTVGDPDGTRILSASDPAGSLAEAIEIAIAAINEANKRETTMTVELMARPGLIATDCVEIRDMGQLSGKYFVESVESSLGDGYRMSVSMRRVRARFTQPASATSEVRADDG